VIPAETGDGHSPAMPPTGRMNAPAAWDAPHASPTLLELAIIASGAGTWSWDATTNRSVWDERYQEMYGFAPQDIPSFEGWLSRVHPEDRDRLREKIALLSAPGSDDTWHQEFRAVHPTKGERWMVGVGRVERDADGRAHHFRGINLDVTERKLAESAQPADLRRLQRVANVGHWVWNTTSNHIVWSEEVYRILRVTPETFEPRIEALVRLIHPDDLPRISGIVAPLVGGCVSDDSIDYRVVLADGSIRHVVSNVGHSTTDEHGRIVQLFGILHDVTDRKRAEEAVLRIGEEERQRVGAELHDGVLQELAGTSYFAAAVLRELEREGHRLAPNVARIKQAIEAMIDHTRKVALAMDPTVPGGSGLVSALRELTRTMASEHGVPCPFASPRPIAVDDPVTANHLYRIAQEAIRNAIRHGRPTQVAVRLTESDDGKLTLAVADDGCGLPPGTPNGTGIGLHVMRYRASVIGAQLAIRNRSSGGTEVVCRLTRR
jgi:PAS domain S-box-containing protein